MFHQLSFVSASSSSCVSCCHCSFYLHSCHEFLKQDCDVYGDVEFSFLPFYDGYLIVCRYFAVYLRHKRNILNSAMKMVTSLIAVLQHQHGWQRCTYGNGNNLLCACEMFCNRTCFESVAVASSSPPDVQSVHDTYRRWSTSVHRRCNLLQDRTLVQNSVFSCPHPHQSLVRQVQHTFSWRQPLVG